MTREISIPAETWTLVTIVSCSFQADTNLQVAEKDISPIDWEDPKKVCVKSKIYEYYNTEGKGLWAISAEPAIITIDDSSTISETSAGFVRSVINPKGGLDVNVQDQTTPAIEYYLARFINDVVVTAPLEAKNGVIQLEAGHGLVVDELLELYVEVDLGGGVYDKRFMQLICVESNATDVLVSPPPELDAELSEIVFSRHTSGFMNVDGSVTPVRFSCAPPNGLKWDLTRTMIHMVVDSNPDDALFGNLPRLAHGMYYGFEGDIGNNYLVNVRANAGFRLTAYDVTYTTRSSGGGSYGVSVRKTFAGQDKYGVAIRLEGETNDEFVAYVNDDLTGLDEFAQNVMGHIVD